LGKNSADNPPSDGADKTRKLLSRVSNVIWFPLTGPERARSARPARQRLLVETLCTELVVVVGGQRWRDRLRYWQWQRQMKEEQQQFLALVGRPPARLTVEQAAWVLGCQPHDVPILIAFHLLKPLGNPSQNGIKFFSTAEVTEMAKDRAWLAKMTQTISQHWHKRNVRQKSHSRNGEQNGLELKLAAIPQSQ
jgi:hypothetical protein